jgi:hypothetical protein
MNFQSGSKGVGPPLTKVPDDGSNGAPAARQPLEETSNEEVSCCFCRETRRNLRSG